MREKIAVRRVVLSLFLILIVAIVFDVTTTFRREFHERGTVPEELLTRGELLTEAMRLAGNPNVDGIQPDEVHLSCDRDSCVATITDHDLRDDSARAEQTRVVFLRSREGWAIEWAGDRWKCWSGRGNPFLVFDWQKSFCS